MPVSTHRPAASLLAIVILAALSGCVPLQRSSAPPPPPPVRPAPAQAPAPAPEPPRPAPVAPESPLAQGLKAYKAGQYTLAEAQLKIALRTGLPTAADTANAHKHLAFIYCTSKRESLCLASFRAAKAADPTFRLTKAEAGHPMWSRTYKRAMAAK